MKSTKIIFLLLLTTLLFVVSCNDDDTLPDDTTTTPRAVTMDNEAREKGILWDHNDTISIYFLNGTKSQKDSVKKYVRDWDDVINLAFNYPDTAGDTQVRIYFDSTTSSGWSKIGKKACLNVTDTTQPTMALYKNISTRSGKVIFDKGTIRHEFGHMLGLIHEQLRPDTGIAWKDSLNIRGGGEQILEEDFEDYVRSEYDPLSIMHYSVRNTETTDSSSLPGYIVHGELSVKDIEFIQSLYPVQN
ncbi:M12 family metallopeptidase [Sinomicrobium sp. M5D2P17]